MLNLPLVISSSVVCYTGNEYKVANPYFKYGITNSTKRYVDRDIHHLLRLSGMTPDDISDRMIFEIDHDMIVGYYDNEVVIGTGLSNVEEVAI